MRSSMQSPALARITSGSTQILFSSTLRIYASRPPCRSSSSFNTKNLPSGSCQPYLLYVIFACTRAISNTLTFSQFSGKRQHSQAVLSFVRQQHLPAVWHGQVSVYNAPGAGVFTKLASSSGVGHTFTFPSASNTPHGGCLGGSPVCPQIKLGYPG